MSFSEQQIELLTAKLDKAHVRPPQQYGPKGDYLEAFRSHIHVEPNSGCWLWLGADNGCGYGKFRGRYAHRISFELAKGNIPARMHLDHKCRVRCCVNPDHLEPVTNAENARRGIVGHHMKYGGAPRGAKHRMARVNEDTVRLIRTQYAQGKSQYALARELGISQPTVSQIVLRKTWRHI